MPQDDRKPRDPKRALRQNHLTLEDLGRMVAVAPEAPDQNRKTLSPFDKIYPPRLVDEIFFQSPVDKYARTIPRHGQPHDEASFIFDDKGVLQEKQYEAAQKALLNWLNPDEKDKDAIAANLKHWVETARRLTAR